MDQQGSPSLFLDLINFRHCQWAFSNARFFFHVSMTSSRRGGLIINIYITSIAMYCSLRLQVNISFLVRIFVSPEVCNCFIFSTCLISYSHIFILSPKVQFFIICSPFPPWVLPSKYFYNPLNLNCLLTRPMAYFSTWSFP